MRFAMNDFVIGERVTYDPPTTVDYTFELHRGETVVLERRENSKWLARFPTTTPDGYTVWLHEDRFKKIEEVDCL